MSKIQLSIAVFIVLSIFSLVGLVSDGETQSPIISVFAEESELGYRYDRYERVATVLASGTVINKVTIDLTNISDQEISAITFNWIGCTDICFLLEAVDPATGDTLPYETEYFPDEERIEFTISLLTPLAPDDSTSLAYVLRKDGQVTQNGASYSVRTADGGAGVIPILGFDMMLFFPDGTVFEDITPAPIAVIDNSVIYGLESLDENDWLVSTIQFTIPPCENDCIVPFLDVPMKYDYTIRGYTFKGGAANALLGRLRPDRRSGDGLVNSYYDHETPTGLFAGDGYLRPWDGIPRAGTYDNCVLGVSCYDTHNAIDFQNMPLDRLEGFETDLDGDGNADEDPIYAAASGTVQRICLDGVRNDLCNKSNLYGTYVIVQHDDYPCYATMYAHLNNIAPNLQEGDYVEHSVDGIRQLIGEMGGTGGWAVHLHFGVYKDCSDTPTWPESTVVDPFGWDSATTDPAIAAGYPESKYLWLVSGNEEEVVDEQGGIASFTRVDVQIPEGTLTDTTLVLFRRLVGAPAAHSGVVSTGETFRINYETNVSAENTVLTANDLQNPVTITVRYDENLANQFEEDNLAIYHRDEQSGAWIKLNSVVDTQNNSISVPTTLSGDFDVQGVPVYKVYMPLVVK